MYSKIFITVSLIIFSVSWNVYCQDNCRTPSNARGTCVNIKQCNPLVTILMNRPIPAASLQFLMQSQCGYEGNDPKVCCPSVATGDIRPPNGNTIRPPNPTRLPNTTPSTAVPPTISPQANFYSEPPPSIAGHRNLGLLPMDCGNVVDDKLYGGIKTGVFDFPWMALLAYNTSRGIKFQCGGTIINPRYILTAAHCLTGLVRKTLIGVRVGEHNLATEKDCEDSIPNRVCAPEYQDMGVEEIVAHPQFIGGRGTNARYQNDVGLVRLNMDIDMNMENIAPICLPITKELQELFTDGLMMTVTGWGATETNISSSELLKIVIPTMNNLQCGRILNASIGDGIGFRQLCAGGVSGVDACGGDSGGPIANTERLNALLRYIQFGIVSFGSSGCGRAGVPGVYTRVGYYMDWILNNMKP